MHARIRYIRRQDLDISRWDDCINNSPNGLVYALSYYLDRMAKHWDALVEEDYLRVMPVTWNRKWGISYLYQPPACASLGIFGPAMNPEKVDEFIGAIPAKFRLVEIDFNSGNPVREEDSRFIRRNNYLLHLKRSYAEIIQSYRENTLRNIRKARDAGCTYHENLPAGEIAALAERFHGRELHWNSSDYEHFIELYGLLHAGGAAITRAVHGPSGSLLSAAILFFSHSRWYYILAGNHPDGRSLGTSHFLIDRFVEEYAGQDLILDFEGSDIHDLAFFYSGFGARVEHYPALRINRLPVWINTVRRFVRGQ